MLATRHCSACRLVVLAMHRRRVSSSMPATCICLALSAPLHQPTFAALLPLPSPCDRHALPNSGGGVTYRPAGYMEAVPQTLRFHGQPMLMNDLRLKLTHDE